ncbi:hypothetical protein NQ315_014007 [Exocentrus adspersus]|uniref:Uncharacterized protein n=1 Tax=Exocentrus adspersus TaxID=1586481 RepID=A0AAV8V7A1_9CUCU|nr:hypothetical protein NQ315_014007 [Exocentrus adspersus]
MTSIDNGLISLEWVLFSDEATFTLHDHINRHKCRYWADDNPQWMRECYTQRSQKTNVWAEIVGDRILGPLKFPPCIIAYMHVYRVVQIGGWENKEV